MSSPARSAARWRTGGRWLRRSRRGGRCPGGPASFALEYLRVGCQRHEARTNGQAMCASAEEPSGLAAVGKPVDLARLTEQPLGEIEPFLHLAQLASHLTDLVTKHRELSLAPLSQRSRVGSCLLEPNSGNL